MAANPIGAFNPDSLSADQKQTYAMQQQMLKEQAAGNQMTLMFQHQSEQQKQRFDSISNALKAGGDTRANMNNNSK